ncbi:MAG: hypothetical protein R3C45_04900 [Phycisphaerales bacterium]
MKFMKTGLTAIALLALATPTYATFVIAGEVQDEQGNPADWDPTNSTLLMSDLGGGIYTVSVPNLLDGTRYDFKIVDDEGTPPAVWGDPEITPNQLTLIGDADGTVQITVDTNITNAIGSPATWINFDNAPFQVVGDFMVAAGGFADWDPADPMFAMTDNGNGYYTYDAVISTPGVYNFKATFGDGWDDQIGVGGFNNNAGTYQFITSAANEPVTMFVDLANRQIGATAAQYIIGTLTVAGDLQTEQGDAADWDVAGSSLTMSESGGVHTVAVSNLVNGAAYDFEIYNDAGNPPVGPGSPLITPYHLTMYGDADGAATITVDTNVTNLQNNPAVWVDFDNAPLQVVGDFMNEAGGFADWDPADPAFVMTAEGNGYYTFDAIISTPGTYVFKASFGAGWGDQVGIDGFSDNAEVFVFETTATDQEVTMFIDLANRMLGILSGTPLEGDLNGDGFVGIADLNIVLGNWNQNVTPGDPLLGDPTGDGFVGIEDLNKVLGNWNAGTPPSANAVPEPATLSLLALAAPP